MKKALTLISLIALMICLSLTFMACPFLDSDNNANSNSNKTVYIGETVKNKKGVEFTVVSVQNTQKIGYSGTTENNFIVVTVRISNNGSETWEQNPINCKLIKDGASYDYSTKTYLLDNNMSSMTEINPGITKTMSIAFETPTKSTEESYSIKLSGYSLWTDDSVTILLKERP